MSDGATSEDDEQQSKEETEESKQFDLRLRQLHESRGTPLIRQPTIGQRELNLFKLYRLVMANGGMDRVTQEMKWRSVSLQLGMPSTSPASSALRQAYKKLVLYYYY